jgi:hypothetical protein
MRAFLSPILANFMMEVFISIHLKIVGASSIFEILIVVFRHGFNRQAGWIYLAIFSVIRIAGAGFTISQTQNPTNKTDIEWAATLDAIGLSPLLLATMGLLKRV